MLFSLSFSTISCSNSTCPCVYTLQAFARYLAYKKDNNELLFFILHQLASEQRVFNRSRYGDDIDLVEIPEDEFVEKVLSRSCWDNCMFDSPC